MNEEDIVQIFKEQIKRYERYDTRGFAIINSLALGISEIEDKKEYQDFVDFMFREAVDNKYNLWAFCIEVIVKLNAPGFAKKLEHIYYEYNEYKDGEWGNEITFSLMDMKYTAAEDLYLRAIEIAALTDISLQSALIRHMFYINKEKFLTLTIEYFCNNIRKREPYVYRNSERARSILYFFRNNKQYIYLIFEKMSKVCPDSALIFKNTFLDFLNSDQTELSFTERKEMIGKIALI